MTIDADATAISSSFPYNSISAELKSVNLIFEAE